MKLTFYEHPVLGLRMSGVIPPLPLYAFMAFIVTT
jgi:hypothetical protein